MLKIENLTVQVLDKIILENFNLEIKPGEIHFLMGQNGAGKSTISKVLLRNNNYEVRKGSISYQDKDILKLTTTEVARLGLFLVEQSPIEIEGVSNLEMLRTTLTDQGKCDNNVLEFNKRMKELCENLGIPKNFINRDINYNMSGGEKKKMEILHMWMLQPNFIILDEIDSGLDVDALKIVANSILNYYKKFKPSILIITHQEALMSIIKPDFVHVLADKKITESGSLELAEKIFKNGFSGASIMDRGTPHE